MAENMNFSCQTNQNYKVQVCVCKYAKFRGEFSVLVEVRSEISISALKLIIRPLFAQPFECPYAVLVLFANICQFLFSSL